MANMGKMIRRFTVFGCIAALSVAGLAVTPADVQAKAGKSPRLSKKKVTLSVGGKYQIKVKNAPKAKITFKSNKKKIASVSKKGKVTAKKAGTAVIKCKVKYVSGKSGKAGSKVLKCTVKVKAKAKEKVQNTNTPAAVATAVPTIAPTGTPTIAPTGAPTESPTKVPTSAPTESPTSAPTESPTLVPMETPDDPDVTPARTYALSYKGMDANNPLLANSFACDPTAIEYNGRVYVYMTNDSQEYAAKGKDGENTYGYITSIHVISSDDMVNWTDHGTFNISGAKGIDGNSTGCCWAPCAAYKKIDGKDKFFLYYTSGGAMIGVAVADSPIGPFRNERGSYLINPWGKEDEKSGADALDPAVFTDDDGTSYLVWGGDCSRKPEEKLYPRIRQLSDDMLSFVGEEKTIEAPYFFEDSGINKIGDKYVFSYCSDWNPRSAEYQDLGLCAIAYMVADSPMGPYQYVGEVLPNCGEVFKKADGSKDEGNNHHSIVKFGDEYYMFYHTMVLRTSMGMHFGGRSTHVNKLSVNQDGTFGLVQQDLAGIPQLKAFDPYQEVSGLTSSNNAGMQAIDSTVVYRKNGKINYVIPTDGARMQALKSRADYQYSWLSLKGADFGDSSPKSFKAVLKGYRNAKLQLKVCADSLDGIEIVDTEIVFNELGEASVSVPVNNSITGKHDIFIEFDGSVLSFESWKFEK